MGVAANVQAVLEWLYALGLPVGRIGTLLGSPNFPAEATVTHSWYIDFSWWWWRRSRALTSTWREPCRGHRRIFVFSYILGDNHPHVLAMPFAILVISLALNLFLCLHGCAGRQAVEAPPVWRRLLMEMPLGWGGWLITAIAVGSLLALNTWDFPADRLLLVLVVWAVLLRRLAGEEDRAW